MVSFREEQRFEWFWNLVTALPALLVGFGLFRQIVLHKPIMDEPGSSMLLWPAFGVTVATFIWFLGIRLVTEVRDDELWIRFYWLRPAHVIKWNEIAKVEAITYRPIRDFGGWGVRWAPRGILYNTRGNRGVRVYLTTGRRVLVGSQRADELAQAINARLGA